MPFRMEGVAAVVEWGYHTAAELATWQVQGDVLEALIRTPHPVYLQQRPLWFTVERPPFKRRLLDISIMGDRLSARIGPKEG